MRIDPTKDALQNVINLINAANGTTFTETAPVSFSGAVAFTGPNGTNTKMTLTGVQADGYSGTQDVYYNRIGLDQNTATPPVGYRVTKTTTPAALLTQALSALNLIPAEVQPIAAIPANAPNVPLTAIANSLVYTGSINLPLVWPAPAPYVFLYDQFTSELGATTPLGSHTGDSGVKWLDSAPYHPNPSGVVSGGYLTTSAVDSGGATIPANAGGVSSVIVPSEHVVEVAISIDQSVGTGVNSKLTIAGGGSYASYQLDVTLNSDGSILFDSLRDGAHQTTTGSWTKTLHVLRLQVDYGMTTVYWDNAQVLQVTSPTLIDTAPVKFMLNNGTLANGTRLDWIKARTNLAMDTLPVAALALPLAVGEQPTGIIAGPDNKIWVTVWNVNSIVMFLRAYDRNTQALIYEINLNTLTGLNSRYTVRAVTPNNIVWCENINPPEVPSSVLRFDGNTGLWKDNITIGQYKSLTSLTYQPTGHMWGAVNDSGNSYLRKYDLDTGNQIGEITLSGDPIFNNSVMAGIAIDPNANRIFVGRRGSNFQANLVAYDMGSGQKVGAIPMADYLLRVGCGTPVGDTSFCMIDPAASDTIKAYDANFNVVRSVKPGDLDATLSSNSAINSYIQFSGPWKYMAQYDEVWFQVFRQTNDANATFRSEVWALRRSDFGAVRQVLDFSLTYGRLQYTYGDNSTYDFDHAGNVYAICVAEGSGAPATFIRGYHG